MAMTVANRLPVWDEFELDVSYYRCRGWSRAARLMGARLRRRSADDVLVAEDCNALADIAPMPFVADLVLPLMISQCASGNH